MLTATEAKFRVNSDEAPAALDNVGQSDMPSRKLQWPLQINSD